MGLNDNEDGEDQSKSAASSGFRQNSTLVNYFYTIWFWAYDFGDVITFEHGLLDCTYFIC